MNDDTQLIDAPFDDPDFDNRLRTTLQSVPLLTDDDLDARLSSVQTSSSAPDTTTRHRRTVVATLIAAAAAVAVLAGVLVVRDGNRDPGIVVPAGPTGTKQPRGTTPSSTPTTQPDVTKYGLPTNWSETFPDGLVGDRSIGSAAWGTSVGSVATGLVVRNSTPPLPSVPPTAEQLTVRGTAVRFVPRSADEPARYVWYGTNPPLEPLWESVATLVGKDHLDDLDAALGPLVDATRDVVQPTSWPTTLPIGPFVGFTGVEQRSGGWLVGDVYFAYESPHAAGFVDDILEATIDGLTIRDVSGTGLRRELLTERQSQGRVVSRCVSWDDDATSARARLCGERDGGVAPSQDALEHEADTLVRRNAPACEFVDLTTEEDGEYKVLIVTGDAEHLVVDPYCAEGDSDTAVNFSTNPNTVPYGADAVFEVTQPQSPCPGASRPQPGPDALLGANTGYWCHFTNPSAFVERYFTDPGYKTLEPVARSGTITLAAGRITKFETFTSS